MKTTRSLSAITVTPIATLETLAIMSLTHAQDFIITDDDWESFGLPPGGNGPVDTTVLDESGNFYAGGEFSAIGNVLVTNVAKWHQGEWSPLGSTAGEVDER